MKELIVIILVLLLVSVGLNVVQFRNAREAQRNALDNNSKLNHIIEDNELYITTMDSVVDHLFDKVKKDSTTYAKKDSVYRLTIKRLNRKLTGIDLSKSTDKQLDSLINILYP